MVLKEYLQKRTRNNNNLYIAFGYFEPIPRKWRLIRTVLTKSRTAKMEAD